MRNLSFPAAFVLAFVFACTFTLAAPSVAGSTETRLPGIGTFAYLGSPVAVPAPVIVVAGLTRANRS